MEVDAHTCERCGRRVQPDGLWRLGVDAPPAGRVVRMICVVCAAEVRRYLLTLPASAQPVHTPEIDDADISWTGRLGWRAARAVAYLGIAAGAFVLVTWLVSR